jgi:uncharacterized protein (TIGR03435 family)
MFGKAGLNYNREASRIGMSGTMTRHAKYPLVLVGRTPLVCAFFLAVALSASAQIAAQPAQASPGKAPVFEAVSVRPAKPDCSLSMYGPAHGRYTGRCVTLWAVMYNAYEVRSFSDYPPGLPAWADKDKFDIEAAAGDDSTAATQKLPPQEQGHLGREMLQSLLADRFGLRVHYESKVQPVYNLVVAKGGLRVKLLPPDQKPGGMSAGHGEMIVHGFPITAFAHWLSQTNMAGRIVVDKTGLTGNYDFDLKWTPDDQQGTADAGPTLFTALEEQLGLKLVSAKGSVETLVVDHVERPSPN